MSKIKLMPVQEVLEDLMTVHCHVHFSKTERDVPILRALMILTQTKTNKVQGAIGQMAHPPTPEFHFLLVFARKSNYGEGYIEKAMIPKCQKNLHSGYISGSF